MRKMLIASTCALMLGAMSVQAGGLGEPIMAPDAVEEATSSSAGGIVVPLLLLVLIAVAVGGGSKTPAPIQVIAQE